MTRFTWLILFRDGFDDLAPLQAALARYREPLKEITSEHFKFGARAELDVRLSTEANVLDESREISRKFPHKDSSAIALCNQRIELSWDSKDDPGLITNLLGFVEPEIHRLVGSCWTFDCDNCAWFSVHAYTALPERPWWKFW
ncbi:hypothetical protein [Rhizobium sp. CNPSo 4039]|uniref:hypothetical protein n=1 Tax=Rhizobium sp. CNPSo 4039 TaxID=3021409 RepID=UPI002549D6AF|nr:hypothetical protein [Rhizobium sp. CNPSo 4039]MDK4715928.1 hypothetical protein [Rhizobium sp. CNPSo 4039]